MTPTRLLARFWTGRRDDPEDGRLRGVRRSVVAALDSVVNEIAEVTAGLDAGRHAAGLMLGTEDGSRFEREARDEEALCALEARILRDRRRLARLAGLRTLLLGMQTSLDGAAEPEAARPQGSCVARSSAAVPAHRFS